LRQLHYLDTEAQLATFGAGVLGPDLEAQLRARGYTLGHFPSRSNILRWAAGW
jgi:alkyldihydroxyacetonephosphate synthase